MLIFSTHASLHHNFFEKPFAPLFFPFTNLQLSTSASLLMDSDNNEVPDMILSCSSMPFVLTGPMSTYTPRSIDSVSWPTPIPSHETSTSRPQPLLSENEENRSYQDLPMWFQSIEPAPIVTAIALMAAHLEHQMLDIMGMPLLNNNTAGTARRTRCRLCGYTFSKQQDLRRHINYKHSIRPHGCTFVGCPKRFYRLDVLTRHRRNVHGHK